MLGAAISRRFFLLPPAISLISTSFPSLERGRPGLFTSRILSLGLFFVPTSTLTLRVLAGCEALGWLDGSLRSEAGSQAPARQKANPKA